MYAGSIWDHTKLTVMDNKPKQSLENDLQDIENTCYQKAATNMDIIKTPLLDLILQELDWYTSNKTKSLMKGCILNFIIIFHLFSKNIWQKSVKLNIEYTFSQHEITCSISSPYIASDI